MKYKSSKIKGFTLIELLVVISIIGLLSSVVLASLNTARAKARDARRKSDLAQIRTALHFYYDKNGHWMEANKGCGAGSGGDGWGWFNRGNEGVNSSYPVDSIADCLVASGFLPTEIMDPTGYHNSATPTDNRYGYMKFQCVENGKKLVFLYAKLETVPQQTDPLTSVTTCDSAAGWDSSYGMNYMVQVE